LDINIFEGFSVLIVITFFFCTIMHRFAQVFPANSIDAIFMLFYLPLQIEPGSGLELYGSTLKAQQP
jgi:hypothetical protein